jgi:hypothetical protein
MAEEVVSTRAIRRFAVLETWLGAVLSRHWAVAVDPVGPAEGS